tara:strand:+ start:961 stop:2856 length:1896 start_codon:yes stop_codon:yes gene_type:complete
MLKLFSALLFLYTTYSISIDINIYNSDKNKVNILLAEKSKNKIQLGLEFLLDTDWKVYWKYPGDVGLGPSLQIAEGSKKHKINIKWPYPNELYEEEVNLTSRVYYNHIILPTEITFFDLSQSKINKIKFILDFQICKEICIPVNKEFIIDIQPENYINNKNIEKIKTFESYVPKDIKFSKSLKGNNITFKPKTVIIELDKLKKKKLLNNENDNFIFLKNNSIGTTRFSKVQEDENKILFFLKDINYDNNVTSKSEAFIKIDDEYFHWTTSNHVIEKNTLSFNFFLILLFSCIGGFILNFMPCVLPVLGLKINTFMQDLQSKNRINIKLSSLSIVLGIISTFLLFALITSTLRFFGQSVGWGMQFQSTTFILFIIFILILFILNLLGLFEIRLPKIFNLFLKNKNFSQNSNTYIKNYFTGILSTLLATPCTAPFVGTAISVALSQNVLFSLLIFLFMGVGKSMPYLIFIVYPHIINFFPKPGKWFAYLKYFFAFLLMLTVLWLINILFTSKQTISENWEEFEVYKINKYLDQGYNVFVDVTAEWCLSCAVNKKLVLDQEDIKNLFINRDIKTLRADWTDRNDNILKYLNTYNKYGIPFNILYTTSKPDGFIFSEILSKNQIRSAIEKYIDTK